MSLKGVDYSHWQARVDAAKLKKAGISFAFVKAGEVHIKTSGKPALDDNLHDYNIAELKKAGIICGDYYYFHPSAGASKQARHYAAIRARNEPDLPPVVDVEDSDAMKPADVSKQLLAFVLELAKATARQPIIYSRNGFLVNQCADPDWPAGTLFWIARYASSIGSLSPKIEPHVVLWQYTDKLKLPGLPVMDGDLWLRTPEELNLLSNSSPLQGHASVSAKAVNRFWDALLKFFRPEK